MRVIAIQRGYFGALREPGDEFEVPDGTPGSWFVPADKPASAKPAGGKSKPKGDESAADLV